MTGKNFLLVSAINKGFNFFSGKLFYKSNRKRFSCGLCVQNDVPTVNSGFTATWTFYKTDFCILSSKMPYWWHKSLLNLVSSSDWLTKCLEVTDKRHRVTKIKRCLIIFYQKTLISWDFICFTIKDVFLLLSSNLLENSKLLQQLTRSKNPNKFTSEITWLLDVIKNFLTLIYIDHQYGMEMSLTKCPSNGEL